MTIIPKILNLQFNYRGSTKNPQLRRLKYNSYLKYIILCKHDFEDSVFIKHKNTLEDIEEHV